MKRRINKPKKSGKDRLFNLITIILAMALVILAAIFLYAINQSHSRYISDADDILSSIETGDYEAAINYVYENRANGVDESDDADYTIPYAIVDYFQAEMDYQSAMTAGDSAKATLYKSRMNEAYQRMGKLQYKSEEIDKIILGE